MPIDRIKLGDSVALKRGASVPAALILGPKGRGTSRFSVVEDDASQPTLIDKMLAGAGQFLNHLQPLGLVNRAVLRHLAKEMSQ
jgi:hypothetical protein